MLITVGKAGMTVMVRAALVVVVSADGAAISVAGFVERKGQVRNIGHCDMCGRLGKTGEFCQMARK